MSTTTMRILCAILALFVVTACGGGGGGGGSSSAAPAPAGPSNTPAPQPVAGMEGIVCGAVRCEIIDLQGAQLASAQGAANAINASETVRGRFNGVDITEARAPRVDTESGALTNVQAFGGELSYGSFAVLVSDQLTMDFFHYTDWRSPPSGTLTYRGAAVGSRPIGAAQSSKCARVFRVTGAQVWRLTSTGAGNTSPTYL